MLAGTTSYDIFGSWHPVWTIHIKPIFMLNEMEIENYIESHLPEMPHCVHQLDNGSPAMENIMGLSSFMEEKFREHDIKKVKKICYVAEHLYNEVDGKVKTEIENKFVGRLSAIMPEGGDKRRQLQAIVPVTIYSIYVQQFLHPNDNK